MNRIVLAVLMIAMATGAVGQSAPPALYATSFRQGSTRITEKNFEVRLTPQSPVYKERVKDAHGADRYQLLMLPRGPEGDNNITSWRVKLRDLRYVIYDDILLTSQEPSMEAKDNLGNLDPGRYAVVPTSTVRVVKVDSFYVMIEVKQFHFSPVDSPYLDSMTVDVKFTNSDPREAAAR